MGQDATIRRTANAAEPSPTGGSAAAPDAPRADQFAVGDVIDDRYELVDVLGRGGMGAVFLAQDRELKTTVALKVLGSDFAEHPDAERTFRQEASNALKMSDNNIVKVLHFDIDAKRRRPYIIMEYMRGAPLDKVIDEFPEGRGFDEVWPIVQTMGRGLRYMHVDAGLVHCDFKPGNVFLTENGTAKLLDMGIARATSRARTADTTIFDVGTLNAMAPPYASPEMFERQTPDPRDDIYGFGCTVYELLTGKHPFAGEWSIRARAQNLVVEPVRGLSKRRWRALRRALAFDRESRTPTVVEFLEAFEDNSYTVRKRVAAVGLASALAAAGLAAWLVPNGNPDEAYVRSLMDRAGTGTLSPTQEKYVENWLAQGQDYLSFARDSFARSDAAGAHRDLRGGADNAEGAFLSVLALRPDEAAARGMLKIVEEYAAGAAVLSQSDPTTALWVACQGYEMHPTHTSIRTLINDLGVAEADIPGACSAAAQP